MTHGITAARPGASAPGRPAARRDSAAALVSVGLGFFVIQLDVTIVNVTLPAIQRGTGGSLLASSGSAGHAPNLHVALSVAAAGYVLAIALAWIAIRPPGSPAA